MTPFYPKPDHEYRTSDISKVLVRAWQFQTIPMDLIVSDNGVYCERRSKDLWEITLRQDTPVKFRTAKISNPNRTTSEIKIEFYTKATTFFKGGRISLRASPFDLEILSNIHICKTPV